MVIISVKSVTISFVHDVEVDFGDVPQIRPFTVEGGRPPHEVTLTKADGTISTIYSDSVTGNCSGTFNKTCTITMGRTDYKDNGRYKITAKNKVKQNGITTAVEYFSITVFKDVVTRILISVGDSEEQTSDNGVLSVPDGKQLTIKCISEGSRMPHKMSLTLPNASTHISHRNVSTLISLGRSWWTVHMSITNARAS